MGLIRLLVIAALVYLAWQVVKNLISQANRRESFESGNGQDAQARLKCAKCGVHVPAPAGFTQNGRHYYTPTHQRLNTKQH